MDVFVHVNSGATLAPPSPLPVSVFLLSVLPPSVVFIQPALANTAPDLSVTPSSPINASENSPVSVTASATDPDNDLVTISRTTNAPFLGGPSSSAPPSSAPNLTASGTPNFNQAGSYFINWVATDDQASPATSSATTSIVIANVNRNPVVTAPAVANGTEGQPLANLTGSASDADAQIVMLEQTNNAPFYPSNTGSIFALNPFLDLIAFPGMPNFNQAGTYQVHWTATDPSSATGVSTTVVTIMDVNRAPVVSAPATMSRREGDIL